MDKFKGSETQKALMAIEQTKEAKFRENMTTIAGANMFWGEYNDIRSKLMTDRFAVKDIAWEMKPIFSKKSLEEIEADIKKHSHPHDIALREYKEKLSSPLTLDINNMPDWASKFNEAEKYLNGLDPETRAYIIENEHAWIEDMPVEVQRKELRRQELINTLKPYWKITERVLSTLTVQDRAKYGKFEADRRKYGNDWADAELRLNPMLRYLTKTIERQMEQGKKELRRNPAIDAAVSEWYAR